ncbi:MAG: Holliday junction branch migration protein RuvA [Cytophagales bacterium]|nr:Holliday junction branch migration protein RuvA [Armatimonadota bacterium]
MLRGVVARAAAAYIVLDVNGVGYKVNVPLTVIEGLPEAGQPLTLVIHMQVREDDISLFGFSSEVELRVFELLLTVSGVGPKVALGLLSALTADDLAQAISSEDVRTLTKVPGVGAKTAQRMVLELKEKIAQFGFERRVDRLTTGGTVQRREGNDALLDDAVSALINLGYNKPEAQRAADAALLEMLQTNPAPKFADLLRASLNRLTNR